jgi:SNF2 family DNA or RNA helicase
VIADEAHRVKDASSQTARALKAASGKAPYRFALTGTPIAHNVMDLWSVLNWLEPEEFPGKIKYQDRMCNILYNVFGGMEIAGLKPEREKEFHTAVDFRLRRMTKDVVLPFLPPVVPERRDVEMSTKQAKAYKDISTSMVAEMADGTMLTAGTGLISAIRLLQLASAYGSVDLIEKPDGKVSERLKLSDPSSKIDAFMDDLPDFGQDQVAVFAVSRQLIELLSARLTSEGVAHGLITGSIDEDERQRHMDEFQDGKTQFILCTIGAGGTGITLTAASTRVFLQRSWSSIEMEQAKDRTRRIGSERHTTISHIDYVTPGTIEEAVIAVLDGKISTMEEILRDAELFAKAVVGKVV